MSEIVSNYQIFMVVFFTLLLMVFLVYRFIFKKEEATKTCLSSNCVVEQHSSLNSKEQDVETFQKLKKLLPPAAGSIFFLRNNDMTVVFHKKGLNGLYSFYEKSKNGEYIFYDEELDELRTSLYSSIEKYLLTFETNSKETSSGYFKVLYNIDTLHLLVDELLRNYDKFIALGEKKLL